MPPDCHHRGIVPSAKFFANRLVEISHQCDLFQIAQILMHQFSELLAEHRQLLSVAAHG
jgi:hypothetical protein